MMNRGWISIMMLSLLGFPVSTHVALTPGETLRVIDSRGLVLTVGYLILEASRAEVLNPGGKPVEAVDNIADFYRKVCPEGLPVCEFPSTCRREQRFEKSVC